MPEPKQKLKIGDLKKVHKLYALNSAEWRFLLAAYEGAKELLRLGFLEKHERESQDNYERRLKEAYGFSYSRSVVDLFNFYLFKEPVKREYGKLKDDKLFELFLKDCNLYKDAWDDFLTNVDLYASVCGFMGLLIDKASVVFDNKQQQLEAEVYPYIAAYYPTAILDWDFDRDEYNRPFLAYLKLLDDDGQYRLWWPDKFEIWEIPEDDPDEQDDQGEDKQTEVDDEKNATFIKGGVNPLGEIPFIWLYNLKHKKRPLGISDIHDVARIDVSILRNLSQGEEVINWGAFPMLRMPLRETKPGVDGVAVPTKEAEVGEQAVLEFDPEHPESKPDWLDSAVAEPINSLLAWIAKKVGEIYRAVNAGGQSSMETSTAVKSGATLKAEFQLLNASLVKKAINLEQAETETLRLWCKWEEREEDVKETSVERARSYDVDDLTSALENVLTSLVIVTSKKFNEAMQKQVVRDMMPAADNDELKEIDDEIEESVETPVQGATEPTEEDLEEEDERFQFNEEEEEEEEE